MSDYPDALYTLVSEQYDTQADVKTLVEQAGGEWSQVAVDGKLKNTIHSALKYLAAKPQWLSRLTRVIRQDGYMTEEVARAVDDFLAAEVALPLPLDELAGEYLIKLYPDVALARAVAERAELTAIQLEQVSWMEADPLGTWRSLLIVAAVEHKVEALIEQCRTDHPDHAVVRRLNLALTSGEDRGSQGGPVAGAALQKALRTTVMRDKGPRLAGLGTRPDQNPGARPVRNGGTDQAESRKVARRLAQQRSAVEALENVRRLMDAALEAFGQQDAHGAVSGVAPGQPLGEYVAVVMTLRTDIDYALDDDAPDLDEVYAGLTTLIATVLEGIHAAEEQEDFTAVAGLADDAARACETVASAAGDSAAGDLLRRVAPYWKMKSAYAQHQAKVRYQKKLLAAPAGEATAPRLGGLRDVADSTNPGGRP